jgi:hypothetical protein
MNNHVTDKQLQAYLDKQDGPETATLEEHLKLCASCRKNLEEYQEIYAILNTDPFSNLPKDFSTKIVSVISNPQESRGRLFESGFIIAFFLFGIAVSVYFVNPFPVITNIANNLFINLGEHATKFLPELNGNLPIFIVAILIFLLVEVIDKKILKPRL